MHIYSRAEWGAQSPRPMSSQDSPVEAFVHHSGAVVNDNGLTIQKGIVRGFQNYHMGFHGWSDIGYHFVVFQPFNKIGARAFEGRRVSAVPAAQLNHNTRTLAICVVGNGDTQEMERNTRYVVEQLIKRYPTVAKLGGHRDVVQTDCPGDKFYSAIPRIAQACNIRHF